MAKRRIEPTSTGLQQLGVHAEVDEETPPPNREPGQADAALEADIAAFLTEMEHWNKPPRDAALTLRIIADRTRYREVLQKWDDHLSGCVFFMPGAACECGYAEARALLGEVPDAKTE